tara:strand:- start:348 stop:1019 length:672 start_codon:yes stop_codon:yes gene_type:complete
MAINVTPIPKLTAFATPTITFGTAAAGSADTVIRSDATIAGVAAQTSVDNTIARYNGTGGQLQGYTSGGPTISDTGTMIATAQPTFGAVSRTAQNNCTGNNTLATIEFDTELWDVGGNFASNIFTAPITGKYLLRAQVQVNAVTSSASAINCMLLTSNRNWHIFQTPGIITSQFTCVAAVVADMDINDTARVQLRVNGEGSDIVDIQADAGQPSTSFTGWLLG